MRFISTFYTVLWTQKQNSTPKHVLFYICAVETNLEITKKNR